MYLYFNTIHYVNLEKFITMSQILTLATAGIKSDQLVDIKHLHYPRVDYFELQKYVDSEVIDYRAYNQTRFGSLFRHWETTVRSDLYLTLLGLLQRQHHNLTFAMSERAGIPFAGGNRYFPGKRPLVSMFTCWSERQERVIKSLGLFSAMDAIIVHCQSMKQHLINLGVAPEKLHVINYSIDHKFFSPCSEIKPKLGQIMSIGEIRSRDYPTLFKAVANLPVQLTVAASGALYAREKTRTPPWRLN